MNDPAIDRMDERALIWAGGRDGTLTAEFLESARIEAEAFRSCAELCRELERGAGVLILADEVLADPESGRLREWLLRQSKWSDIPVVVVARRIGAPGALNHMLNDFNGVSVLHRPLSLDTLISTVAAALRARRRQYQVRDLLQHRDETDRRREEFLAMLAHELRNPLSPIRTGLQVLRVTESEDLAARVRSMMERQVRNLSRLIDDLLDVSRITRGKISLKMQAVEISRTLAVVVEGHERLAAEKGLRIEFVADRESPTLWVNADPVRLEQMIENVVSNAIKYTPEKGLISLRATREGSDAVIRIKDTGIGIPPEMLGTVFELFAQTDRALDRSQGGLGIGLTIVKTLAELHQGSVEAISAGEGHGTEIVLRLPALAATDIIEARSAQPSASRSPSRNVLVIEDNREAADILAMYLRSKGHTVNVAYDGGSGLETALRARPEVIICDIGLPAMDGYALARALRKASPLANCLLVAVTGYGEVRDKDRGQQAGFDHYLVKPADPEEIAGLLATPIANRNPADWHGPDAFL
jgi:signal transduction histidine kinase/CheY-like chemotaxis protein